MTAAHLLSLWSQWPQSELGGVLPAGILTAMSSRLEMGSRKSPQGEE